ncbi:helix-turn-helix transcriptional regulator [Flavisolibacter sp. BT320]|nr:helix-turn-helix transcriptional regulator [Flavisolibacter longurius]
MVTISQELVINKDDLKRAGLVFRAANHKLRQQILVTLNGKGGMTVTHLYKKLNLEQSVASQHLAILRQAGLVCARREGKNVLYSVNNGKLNLLHTIAGQLLK